MTFQQWIEQYFSSFESKILACYDEIVSAAAVVDIDSSQLNYSVGVNKGRTVDVLSSKSKGRCRVYLNEKKYGNIVFPHLVFLNLRHSFSSSDGKATPSVVDCLNILFERYKSHRDNTSIPNFPVNSKPVVSPSRNVADQSTLINEQRLWFSRLQPYRTQNHNSYFKRKGMQHSWFSQYEELLNIRTGFSPRYGLYSAIPLRRCYSDSFSGFQRIYENGAKIMIRDFNPMGLCSYFPSALSCRDLSNANLVLVQEGHANALMGFFMCRDLGLENVINLGAGFVSNVPVILNDLYVHLESDVRVLHIYDNDKNEVGFKAAKDSQAANPALKISCFGCNDLTDLVNAFGYKKALRYFADVLLKAFSSENNDG